MNHNEFLIPVSELATTVVVDTETTGLCSGVDEVLQRLSCNSTLLFINDTRQ